MRIYVFGCNVMQSEAILKHAPLRLTDAEREHYFEHGFVAIDSAISATWLEKLSAAKNQLIARSRAHTASDDVFVLEDGHSAETPRLHRIYSPQDHHPDFWAFMRSDEMTELAADVVGPGVKFHHAKLNLKSGRGSRGFKWHQDIQAWPHTDYSPVTVGVYLDGCDMKQGPLSVVPNTHSGALFSMYDDDGRFAVRVSDDDMASLGHYDVASPTGGPGTVILLHCRAVHGSATNTSSKDRPLLLTVYSSADSFAYTSSPIESPKRGEIVRGKPARYACFDTRPCELPPDWGRIDYGGPWIRQQRSKGQD